MTTKMISSWLSQLRHRLIKQEMNRTPTPPVLAIIMVLAATLVWLCTRSSDVQPQIDERATADTYVPKGFQLVPIEVENYSSLDPILGQQGVVDLYAVADEAHTQPRRVATRIKILRAPLNPSSFAVVATHQQAPSLLKVGRFMVSVHNPHETGTEVEVEKESRPAHARVSRIIVESVE